MCIFTGALFISVKKEKHSKCPPPSEGMNTVKPVSSFTSIISQQQRCGERRQATVWKTQTFMQGNRKAHIFHACTYMEKSSKGHTKRPVVSGPGIRMAQGLSL